ncbi:MAG: SDR family oxidoreductase [Desulfobacterales bacterium]|nr:SDR family oxidoreductase [Desulfobacterales bacterium]
MDRETILVTGSTGYIGGRLIPQLLNAGFKVRAVARSLDKLISRPWNDHPNLEVVKADFLNSSSLNNMFNKVHAAYYLIHSMGSNGNDFAEADRKCAINFITASSTSSLSRIIYLGGLGGDELNVSRHLKSRDEVFRILSSGKVPVTTFKAGHIIGSGSASFELLRYLCERLPFFLVPKRIINTEIQPICVRNVLNYLIKSLEKDETIGKEYSIGGPEVLTYRKLFETYASCAGLRKPVFIDSVVPPFKAGTKIGLSVAKFLVPLSPSISIPLLEGMHVKVIAKENRIQKIIPQELMTNCEAINRAIQKDSLRIVDTRWTDAGEIKPPEWVYKGDATYSGGTLLQGGYKMTLDCTPQEIWDVISKVGGDNGWFYGDILWNIRGLLDDLAGGVGLRRGRRNPDQLYIGDALDFWRVLDVKSPKKLILLAEMKLPGEAILNFEINPFKYSTELKLGTRFKPVGLYGILYWYSLLPFHNLLFGGMFKEIARRIKKKILYGPEKYKPGPLYF